MSAPTATILLVEDDFLLRDALRLLLEDAGYRVLEAGTAADALDQPETEPPSLVVLDLGLPDRNGLDVARELRRRDRWQEVPIVALTGRTGAADRQRCLDAGCTDCYAKPLQPSELLARVGQMLGR